MDSLPMIPTTTSVIRVGGNEFEVKVDDFVLGRVMGKGQFGCVYKATHMPSKLTMAIKKIHYSNVSSEDGNYERLLRELDVSMSAPSCNFLVSFYCSLFWEGEIWICMELMDASLDSVYKALKQDAAKLPEHILAHIASGVVRALHHLHSDLKIIHRDVKPSNILTNRRGDIKLCDFGICGRLKNSVVFTMSVGCKPYMAPERINPEAVEGRSMYGIRSDVWSFGVTMVELATGEFPYKRSSLLFSIIHQVVYSHPPRLPADSFSPDFQDFIAICLEKDLSTRATYKQLLCHPFIATAGARLAEKGAGARLAEKGAGARLAEKGGGGGDGGGGLDSGGMSNDESSKGVDGGGKGEGGGGGGKGVSGDDKGVGNGGDNDDDNGGDKGGEMGEYMANLLEKYSEVIEKMAYGSLNH